MGERYAHRAGSDQHGRLECASAHGHPHRKGGEHGGCGSLRHGVDISGRGRDDEVSAESSSASDGGDEGGGGESEGGDDGGVAILHDGSSLRGVPASADEQTTVSAPRQTVSQQRAENFRSTRAAVRRRVRSTTKDRAALGGGGAVGFACLFACLVGVCAIKQRGGRGWWSKSSARCGRNSRKRGARAGRSARSPKGPRRFPHPNRARG